MLSLVLSKALLFMLMYCLIHVRVYFYGFWYSSQETSWALWFSTPTGESILAKKLYRDCTISTNHKDIMTGLVELDMVEFDVIIGMD